MKVHHEIEEKLEIERPVLTIGTFDGVHLGHQKILKRLITLAKKINGESVVLTFHPHPRIVLNPEDHNLELIQPIEKRIQKLEELGIDHLILYPFTKEFSRMPATVFVRDILVNKIGVNFLNIGYDHHFGRNREGSIELLRELSETYGFEVEETPAFEKEEVKISSTKIRNAIKTGDVGFANSFLGYIFSFQGRVVTGKGLGKQLGFPTANLEVVSPYQITPGNGVYAVVGVVEGLRVPGMMNVGVAPTISEDSKRTFEVHFFDFDKNIYGKIIEIECVKHIRSEKKFESLESLINQIKQDEVSIRNILV